MTTSPRRVELIDVGPRDGLQNETKTLDVATKVDFIGKLVDAGIRRMEAVSFVNPKRVPQMAEAEEVLAARELDKFGYPVSRRHQRREPFDTGDAWSRC